MDIVVIGIGSRGDVQPYLALARGLRYVGHRVRLVAPPNFASLAQQYEVEFCSVGVDFQHLLDNERFKSIVESGKFIRSLPALRREFLEADRTSSQESAFRSCLALHIVHRSLSILAKRIGHSSAFGPSQCACRVYTITLISTCAPHRRSQRYGTIGLDPRRVVLIMQPSQAIMR